MKKGYRKVHEKRRYRGKRFIADIEGYFHSVVDFVRGVVIGVLVGVDGKADETAAGGRAIYRR